LEKTFPPTFIDLQAKLLYPTPQSPLGRSIIVKFMSKPYGGNKPFILGSPKFSG